MRITSLYLKKWLQLEFKRLEIDIPVLECYKTRFRTQDYECGAAFYVFRIGDKQGTASIYIFSNRGEIEEMIHSGYELYLKPKDGKYLNEAIVGLRKK